jgi:type 1 fimbria pilin
VCRTLILLIGFGWLLAVSGVAHGTTLTCSLTSMNSVSPTVGASTFGRDAPVGSTTQAYPSTLNFHCPGDPCCDRDAFVTFAASPTTAVPGYTDVYPTNVPGVGVRYTVSNGSGTTCRNLPTNLTNGSYKLTCHYLTAANSPGYDFAVMVSAIFVKTGAITSGPLTTIPAVKATGSINNQGDSWPWGNIFSSAAAGSFASIACSVADGAIKVDMPQANTRDLQTVGATTAKTPFNVSLNCDAGVRVAVTLTDVSTPANRSTTLTLTQDSTASGIGYQIAYQGAPVAFGADSSVAGNAGQIFVSPGPTVSGVLSVPMTVSYIRTGIISPGTANAKATFTMSYQ